LYHPTLFFLQQPLLVVVAINRSSVLGHICQFIVYAPQEDFTN